MARVLRILPLVTLVLAACRIAPEVPTGPRAGARPESVFTWAQQEAQREALEGGFGFHRVWWNLERQLSELDGERLRRAALPAFAPPE